MKTRAEQERELRHSVERLDVLEDELPRSTCMMRGCSESGHHVREMGGHFYTRWLCPAHRFLYWQHDQIVARILAIPPRVI